MTDGDAQDLITEEIVVTKKLLLKAIDADPASAGGKLHQLFVIAGVIKFAKLRGGCRQRLFRIAEETHAKTRVGAADDGITYQGITKHLHFQLVFEEKPQVEDFETAVKKIPLEYRRRKYVEFLTGVVVVPDISVEVHHIQHSHWQGGLIRIEEDHYEKIDGDFEPSPEYDMDSNSLTSVVSVNAETRLRMLEREDSINFFRQKPEKCHIVRQADDPENIRNPNNIVYMSRFLHQQLDAIDSTEGIPQFYLRYVAHSEQLHQGIFNNKPIPTYETTFEVVFKDEEAKNVLTLFFNNPTDVNLTTIRMVAYFPDPLQFNFFTKIKAEETLARWASYDGLL